MIADPTRYSLGYAEARSDAGRTVRCPTCGAKPGETCRTKRGHVAHTHRPRRELYRRAARKR